MTEILKNILIEFAGQSDDEIEIDTLIENSSDIGDEKIILDYAELTQEAINIYLTLNKNISLIDKIYLENLSDYHYIYNLLNRKEILCGELVDLEKFNSSIDNIFNLEDAKLSSKLNELFYLLFSNYNQLTLTQWDDLLKRTSDEVKRIHHSESESKKLNGHIYKFDTEDEVIIIGDIHGDIHSLWQIFTSEKLYDLTNRKLIFLGDYIDRGNYQLSTLFFALFLKKLFPENVYLLKGNHENFIKESDGSYRANVSGDEDLFIKFWKNYLSEECLTSIITVLNDLPVVIELNSIIGIVHGGLPRPTNGDRYDEINTLDDLNTEERKYEMIWNRPVDKEIEVIITGDSDFETSLPHFNNFTERLGWKFMVRGHCVDMRGYKLFYENRMATIFTSGSFMAYSGYQSYRPVYANIKDNVFYIKKVFGNEVLETIDVKEL